MKKFLSALLAVLMVLSAAALTACGQSESETPENNSSDAVTPSADDTETTLPDDSGGEIDHETLNSSLPKEYMREKVAAGMEVTIALCAPSLASDLMIMMDRGMKEQFEAQGFNYVSSSFDADTTKLIEQLENYTTMGVSLIMTMIFDNAMADIAADIMDAGIYLVLWSFAPQFPVSMAMFSDEYTLGGLAADMASYWVGQQYPDAGEGEVHMAMLTSEMNQTYITRFNGVRDGVAEDSRIALVFEDADEFMTIDTGYNFAQSAMTYDSGIRLFISMTASQSMGINNYVVGQGYSSEQLKEFAAFGTDNDSSSREMIDQAKAGGDSILRGLVSSGTDDPSDYICDYLFDLIDGVLEEGSIMAIPQYSYDAVGFDYDERT